MENNRKRKAERYGVDRLNCFSVIFGFVLALCLCFTGRVWWILAGYIPLVFAVFRALSRNRGARVREAKLYMRITAPIRRTMRVTGLRLKNGRMYRYIICPDCKAVIRISKGKGRVRITCRKCGKKLFKMYK